jgi:CRISPR/Cas system CSM-associated protein Csm2 small subunit
MKNINQKDINEINIKIFKQINRQLDKDLNPNQFNSIARLALAFQKVTVVADNQEGKEIKGFEKIMEVLDLVEISRLDNPDKP